MSSPAAPAPSAVRRIAPMLIPAIVVGIACSLLLIAVSELARLLQTLLWDHIPSALGIAPYGLVWIIVVFMAAAVAIVLIEWFVPGHAGPDPATVSLVSKPLPAATIPGLLAAVILMLASGISLGPENPIMAATVALAVAFGPRLARRLPGPMWVSLAISGTVGALFGTPVAAALLISETLAESKAARRQPLWDALMAPLAAAGAGAITTHLITSTDLSVSVPAYTRIAPLDILTAALIAAIAAGIGLAASYVFPLLHALFAKVGHQRLTLLIGALILALLAALGGPLTMFKGLNEMGTIADHIGNYSAWGLLAMGGIKLLALMIASSSGFRGGRIFPAVFVGAMIGFAASAWLPQIPPAVAVAAAVMGMTMAVTHHGWLSLFTAVVVVPNMILIPLMCIAAIPAWLVISGRREMLISTEKAIPS